MARSVTMKYFIAFLSSFLFSIGLAISGMTNPSNIIGFLDVFGAFNLQLVLVMLGAVGFHGLSYFLIKKKASPLLTEKFLIPRNKKIDMKLVTGAALFGIGWGIGGYCPGPALVSLVSLSGPVLVFSLSMIVGIAAYHYFFKQFLTGERS